MLRNGGALRGVENLSRFRPLGTFPGTVFVGPVVSARVVNSSGIGHVILGPARFVNPLALTDDDPDFVSRMYEIFAVIPVNVLFVILLAPAIDVAEDARRGNPDDHGDDDHGSDDVISEEHEYGVYVDVFDDVPEPLHDILDRFLAFSLIKLQALM